MTRSATWLALSICLLAAGCTSLPCPPEEEGPPPFDFRLGPGDRLQVSVWGEQQLTQEIQVAADGSISYPLIGDVQLGGMSLAEARVEMAKRLRDTYVDPVVSLTLIEMRSHVLHVAGEVARPGTIPYVTGATVLGAIQAAGGFIPATAELGEVRVIRRRMTTPQAFVVDVESVLEGSCRDMWLAPGDAVYVPPRLLTRWSRWWHQALGGEEPAEERRRWR
jgi:polysaccharide export outer membrane protein